MTIPYEIIEAWQATQVFISPLMRNTANIILVTHGGVTTEEQVVLTVASLAGVEEFYCLFM